MPKKLEALIIFPDEWLAYSPSILNLIECLKMNYNVNIIAVDNGQFNFDINLENLTLVKLNYNLTETIRLYLRRFKIYKSLKLYVLYRLLYKLYKLIFLYTSVKKAKNEGKSFDIAFGVDSIGFIVSKIHIKNSVYYSLEIEKDVYLELSKLLNIENLIIQTEERKQYLFDNKDMKVSYIQNSPIIINEDLIISKETYNSKLIYLGSIIPSHSIDIMVKMLSYLDQEYTLTLKGIINDSYEKDLISKYEDLIKLGRLIIDKQYIPQSEIIDYLRDYDIGLCFYNFDLINKNDFNYLSSPSGKLFNYYAAGIPVISNDIIGMQSVYKYNTGLLLKELSPQTIANAIREVKTNYYDHSNNAIKAAKEFNYLKGYKQFKKNINQD